MTLPPASRPLFRQEVLDARRQGWLGSISLVQPLRWRVLAGVALALATAALCMLCFASYAARTRVSGQLVMEATRLQAQLWVPGSAIGFIAPGDRMLLRYRAFPYQKFGQRTGRVVRIARNATTPAGRARGAEPVYRVLVQLDQQSIMARGALRPLRPGMLLDADIPGERRRLYQWVLTPLSR